MGREREWEGDSGMRGREGEGREALGEELLSDEFSQFTWFIIYYRSDVNNVGPNIC